MRNGRTATYLTVAGLVVTVGLLGLIVAQLNGIEERLVVQGQQIRSLGEATDRLSERGRRPQESQVGKTESEDVPAHVLHPEVPNFLKPKGTHWPSPGANTDGILKRDWYSGDPKGFNDLLENSEDLVDKIEVLAGATIADRNFWTNPDEWNGVLASRVEITDDSREFTIYLKHAKWHRPLVDLDDPKHAWLRGEHPVTAHDFVFALDMIANPQVENGFLKNYYSELESWKAIDDTTLVIRWKKKQYLNLEFTLSLTPMAEYLYAYDEDGTRFPKDTIGLRFSQHWYNNKGYMGAGAYRMASYEPGTRMRLVRNEDYVGEKPAIKEVIFPIYTDRNQTLLKLKAHDLSTGVLTPSQYREEIQPFEHNPHPPANNPFFDGRIECRQTPRFAYYFIGWNADRPLFADKRVRRAMTLALNRVQIIESVFAGLGRIISGPFVADSPWRDPNIMPLPFDLQEAKRLLDEAGWKDTDGDGIRDSQLHPGDNRRTPFEFTLLTNGGNKELAALANIYKEDLLKIGVKLNADAPEWSLMQRRMAEKSFDAYTGGWTIGWDEDLYQIWHSSQADAPNGSNRVGFRNKEADAIIEKIRVTFDREERLRLFQAFHRIAADEQPYTFIFSKVDLSCSWNDVKDIVFARSRPSINTLPWSVARSTP